MFCKKSEIILLRYHYFFWMLVLLFLLCYLPTPSAARINPRPKCPEPVAIPNGSYRLRRNNMIMRVSCRPGFELQGSTIIECVHGKWYGRKPICAKKGCVINSANPEHGIVQMDGDYRMILFCLDSYNLAGNRIAYCNGTHWDRQIGNCREQNYDVSHECDFETDDLCGWVIEETHGVEWRRVMAANIYTSYHTGPRHDHTTMSAIGGYYMLMETLNPYAQPAILLSPIYERELSLKTACCFQFYYFMFGSGVGELSVYVRPVSVDTKRVISQKENYMKFTKSGNQNNLWNEGNFTIPELDEDFQIMIVATAGKSHLSDIAIDDVNLMIGDDCKTLEKASEEIEDTFGSSETTEPSLFDMQSCVGRCADDSGFGFIIKNGFLFGRCNCELSCVLDDSCCPDFLEICLAGVSDSNEDTNILATELQTTSSTTTTTTTTTRKPTTTTRKTTTTTTTTTTPKPVTIRRTTATTTTTTTTPKPITSTTPKPTTKPTLPFYPWRINTTTTTTKLTTTKTTTPTTTTTTTLKPTIKSTTTTLKPKNISPNAVVPQKTQSSTEKSNPQKKKVNSWNINNENQQYHKTAGRILLTILILIVFFIVLTITIYHYGHRFGNWCLQLTGGDTRNGAGDVETTSIRAKFLKKPYAFNTVNVVSGIKNRLSRSGSAQSDDVTGLMEYENDHDTDGYFGVDNPCSSSNSHNSPRNSSNGNCITTKDGVSTIL